MFGADTMAMINAVLPFFLMGGIFYFMLWKPQKKQQQDRQNLLNSLKKGDKIIYEKIPQILAPATPYFDKGCFIRIIVK